MTDPTRDRRSPLDKARDGLRAIAAGQPVAHDGANGRCVFTDVGDIKDCAFRCEQVQGGKITLLRIV